MCEVLLELVLRKDHPNELLYRYWIGKMVSLKLFKFCARSYAGSLKQNCVTYLSRRIQPWFCRVTEIIRFRLVEFHV